VPFDLSQGAVHRDGQRSLSAIPGPLRDRMEVIEIAGYSLALEKRTIARATCWRRSRRTPGLEPEDVAVDDAVLAEIMAGWTREAGVRELQRVLGKLYRAAAVEKARGTWSPPLVVDASELPRLPRAPALPRGRPRGHVQAGHRARAGLDPGRRRRALRRGLDVPGSGRPRAHRPARRRDEGVGPRGPHLRARARRELGIPLDVMSDKDVHVHVPAGGVPKDGPSAGVTMFTRWRRCCRGGPCATTWR
jgi:ATP-dependent Lon protease